LSKFEKKCEAFVNSGQKEKSIQNTTLPLLAMEKIAVTREREGDVSEYLKSSKTLNKSRWEFRTNESARAEGKPGERGRIRTCDPCLKRALLYQLSYAPSPSSKLVYHC
jgi:hypothetical protein